MNRKQRRGLLREQRAHVEQFPEHLTPISPQEFPHWQNARLPIKAWRSRKYLVQLYECESAAYPNLVRLSICRVKLSANGQWEDALTWDELQSIKHEVGFGAWYGVEVYPPDKNVVNVANLRHLWLLPAPLDIGWF
jgi:hypothetical protein